MPRLSSTGGTFAAKSLRKKNGEPGFIVSNSTVVHVWGLKKCWLVVRVNRRRAVGVPPIGVAGTVAVKCGGGRAASPP
jgi:hypothetical protein